MKLKLITFFAVLVFASVSIVALAHAQDDKTVKANIPFDFYAGKQKMSAGSYRIGIDLGTELISFTDESGKHKIFLMGTPNGEGEETAQLVFEHLGDVYALQELKSDVIGLAFQTRMPVPVMESGNASSQVEVVALNR
jgi:hypothetical protein